ncbi:MAG: ABC transporter ATP-binding protein [Clostridiales bacterium]|nr:ABC transporter ATP-binding protein [Clostridiales bacterium]
MSEAAITVDHISKMYKLYDNPMDRLKESLGLSRKKRYREHFALDQVSFQVNQGETVGIIGTNGSGKSTILKIITGVLNPTSGNLSVNGRISALLELGAGFNMEYSGLENVYLNGTMIGFSREEIDQKLDAILSFADIGDFIHQPVKTYSSGMFVRLAFAVAINIDPEILIVDEALSVGDVFFQAKCYKKFEDFKKLGKTILFVSHDLGSISKYCDRVVLLNKGKKLAEGSPKEMVDLYKKVMVGLEDEAQKEGLEDATDLTAEIPGGSGDSDSPAENPGARTVSVSEGWKRPFDLNPNVLDYGNGKARIVDFTMEDGEGIPANTIEKGTEFVIRMKVEFQEKVAEPIFAYSIKNLQGTEITGTNTMYENTDVSPKEKGQVCEIAFRQEMNLQGGEYLLSLGCTGYVNGNFEVFHRLYDVCAITVVSVKNTVGFYDMNSVVTVR